jgi:acetyltransferase-like isoleucine patch superfamily enzyme
MDYGSALGAMSLLKNHIPPYQIFGGSPAKQISTRNSDTLQRMVSAMDSDVN